MFELDELELFPESSRTVRFANCSTHLYTTDPDRAGDRAKEKKKKKKNSK
jgi:hypothetical protein